MESIYRGNDDSLTHRHAKCLLKLFKFFGQELLCPQMTNVKALVLGSTGVVLSGIIPISDGLHLPTNVCHTTIIFIRTISWLTMFLETFKLISRIRMHYSIYFFF